MGQGRGWEGRAGGEKGSPAHDLNPEVRGLWVGPERGKECAGSRLGCIRNKLAL